MQKIEDVEEMENGIVKKNKSNKKFMLAWQECRICIDYLGLPGQETDTDELAGGKGLAAPEELKEFNINICVGKDGRNELKIDGSNCSFRIQSHKKDSLHKKFTIGMKLE